MRSGLCSVDLDRPLGLHQRLRRLAQAERKSGLAVGWEHLELSGLPSVMGQCKPAEAASGVSEQHLQAKNLAEVEPWVFHLAVHSGGGAARVESAKRTPEVTTKSPPWLSRSVLQKVFQ
eukprot:CAMPEP_0170570844 /NCGR_PEP_ID=MMETSP0224-20130122/1334_1 /TAXON_ID=285029 /ORGANISM="Togula jolla, Strain CCCM 725" /LENGTH=118 /DNA_ID=CAMNT_0010893163 /DNA_START=124 /DNA_END=476 /DNA_ORIENTATION=-